MSIKKKQIERKPDIIDSSATPSVGSGQGAFYPKTVSGITEGFYIDDQGREIQLTEDGLPKGGSGGSSADEKSKVSATDTTTDYLENKIVAGTNITITKQNTGSDETLQISASGSVGEANTASNVGTGVGNVFKQKTGIDLEFRKIKAGTNVTVSQVSDDIVIEATGGSGAVDSVNGQTGVVVLDADDISDAATTKKFTTVANLSKLSGIESGAQVNVALASQVEAEAGTENTKTMTALRTAQAIAALAGGSSVSEYKFTLPAAADLASRIAIVSGLPSGWALAPASTAGEAQFSTNALTLVVTWDSGLGTKIAQEITVFQKTISGPDAVQGIARFDLSAAGKVKTNTSMTKAAVYLDAVGVDPLKDLIVFIKLI